MSWHQNTMKTTSLISCFAVPKIFPYIPLWAGADGHIFGGHQQNCAQRTPVHLGHRDSKDQGPGEDTGQGVDYGQQRKAQQQPDVCCETMLDLKWKMWIIQAFNAKCFTMPHIHKHIHTPKGCVPTMQVNSQLSSVAVGLLFPYTHELIWLGGMKLDIYLKLWYLSESFCSLPLVVVFYWNILFVFCCLQLKVSIEPVFETNGISVYSSGAGRRALL